MSGRMTSRMMIFLAVIILIADICVFSFILKPMITENASGGGEAIQAMQMIEVIEPDFEYDENLILVNKTHSLEKTYEPEDLVMVRDRAGSRHPEYQKMRPEAADAFDALTAAAKSEGHTIVATSGYRPYDYQEQLYNNYLKTKGKEWTDKYSAKPGTSEHQTGFAVDVSSPSVNYQLDTSYGKTEEGKWLAQNAHKYGFILRYQEGKEDITGYAYEPWHIRYVGKKAASKMYEKNITLEEYLGAI